MSGKTSTNALNRAGQWGIAGVLAVAVWFSLSDIGEYAFPGRPLPVYWVTALALGMGLLRMPIAVFGVAVGSAWHFGFSAWLIASISLAQWFAALHFFHRRQSHSPQQTHLERMFDFAIRIQPAVALAGNGCKTLVWLGFNGAGQESVASLLFIGWLSDCFAGMLAFLALEIFHSLKKEFLNRSLEGVLVLSVILFLSLLGNADFAPMTVKYQPRLSFFFPVILWSAIRLGPASTGVVLITTSTIYLIGLKQGSGWFGTKGAGAGVEFLLYYSTLTLTGLLAANIWKDRNRVEAALRQSEIRNRAMIENAPEAIVVFDLDTGLFIDVNPQAEKFFSLSREELLKLGPAGLSPELQPDGTPSQEKAREKIASALRGETPIFEWLHRDGRGEDLPCEIRLMRLPDNGKSLVRATLIGIKDRLAAEKSRLESERALAQAQAIAHMGSFVFDPEAGTSTWSDEMYRLFERPLGSETISRDDFYKIVPPADRAVLLEIHKKIHSRENASGEFQVILPSGTMRHLHMTVDIQRNIPSDKMIIVGTFLDITERKKAELEVRALNQELEFRVKSRTAELEAANRSLESFSYSVSHDLRAPLRSMDGFSKALAEQYGSVLDGEARDYLARIRRASQRMAGLIDDLLELTRLTRKEMRGEPIDLSAMAEEVAETLKLSFPERKVDCEIVPGMKTFGDPGLAHVILLNLLGNAWKFTSKASSPRITMGPVVWKGRNAFRIADNGAGFDMAYAHKLFGPFQRLHSREEFEGNGIGLALVEKIVARHDGFLDAQGKVDQGAEFYFSLEPEAKS